MLTHAPIDSPAVSNLLSLLASSLYSTLDVGVPSVWTHLDLPGFDSGEFIEDHYNQPMRSLLNSLRESLPPEAFDSERVGGHSEALMKSLRRFRAYAGMSDAALLANYDQFTTAFRRLSVLIRDLAQRCQCPVAFLDRLTPDREADYRQLLVSMLATLRQVRDTGCLS